jgi:hypothetical protein
MITCLPERGKFERFRPDTCASTIARSRRINCLRASANATHSSKHWERNYFGFERRGLAMKCGDPKGRVNHGQRNFLAVNSLPLPLKLPFFESQRLMPCRGQPMVPERFHEGQRVPPPQQCGNCEQEPDSGWRAFRMITLEQQRITTRFRPREPLELCGRLLSSQTIASSSGVQKVVDRLRLTMKSRGATDEKGNRAHSEMYPTAVAVPNLIQVCAGEFSAPPTAAHVGTGLRS